MNLFWDTSAVLSMIFDEPHSAFAQEIWESSDVDYAWRWLAIEATTGLIRRRANAFQWNKLTGILSDFHFVDMTAEDVHCLCQDNREWFLRAADAGHLYVFKKVKVLMPDIEMMCFDHEVQSVMKRVRLPFRVKGGGVSDAGGLRERRATYGRGKKRKQT